MTTLRRLTGGRAWAARLTTLFALAAVIALIVAVLPAQGAAVPGQKVTHTGGGATADCQARDTEATNYFLIVNPSQAAGQWIQDSNTGAWFKIEMPGTGSGGNDESFDFFVSETASETAGKWKVYDVVVKGSKGSFWYDYDGLANPTHSDENLTSPPRGNKFQNVSHIAFCYDILILDCGQSASLTGPGGAEATVNRGANEDEADCSPKSYTYTADFTATTQFVDLQEVGGISQVGTYLETIQWSPIEPDGQDVGELRYDDDGTGGAPERPMEFCLIDPRGSGTGGLEDGLDPGNVLPPSATAFEHTSCLIEVNMVVLGSVQVTHTIYNFGDGRRSWA